MLCVYFLFRQLTKYVFIQLCVFVDDCVGSVCPLCCVSVRDIGHLICLSVCSHAYLLSLLRVCLTWHERTHSVSWTVIDQNNPNKIL